ncbi:4'-phosphopantetheinyl transferase superfamily protein [Tahibacter sp.]|uniref:4'-phosphopantetheinyl transferase family protein n=1 Tax=Tahibacter sp. TaxID=2056211 RepID=UPI0028C4B028|nr:4'-phosphopantetheinyl transferase superfamily protein [Tahibacter sp.]
MSQPPGLNAPLTLEPGEVHVWYCWTAQCLQRGLADYYRSLLSAEEKARLLRFHFEYLQHEYLVTRALCRITLSRYVQRHPADWRFRVNAYGRPEIDMPGDLAPLRFNLSNARSLVACAITRSADAGVDVEETDRPGETVGIADHFFSPTEVIALQAQPPERQRQRFFEYWTLKESYIKARGMGLSIPLEQFSFDLDQGIRIRFDPALQDDPDIWQFELHQPSAQHQLAIGVRCGPRPHAIHVREVVPAPELLGAAR